MLLCTKVLKFSKYKFLTAKGYRPTSVAWAIKGDYSPGPYPQTKAERQKAAKRYGLIYEDYEPYPDDGLGIGDYPNLPLIAGEARDPYYSWNTDLYRDYKEPVHITWNLTSDRIDPNYIPVGGWWKVMLYSWGSLFGFGFLCWLASPYQLMWPAMEKLYPYEYLDAWNHMKTTGEYPKEIKRRIHYSFPKTPQDMELHP
ncbi:unnamed protein product [Gordionus sp. m RMFG-2023]|uniref:NADH dehydrogenase [ubiquinone] 1 beta subcomplex subunit 8, mitochondrial-like n=1 Tax=Gordionus sp. m RMFG-2023 TaxID=3053472 RepID=UPI0030E1CA10